MIVYILRIGFWYYFILWRNLELYFPFWHLFKENMLKRRLCDLIKTLQCPYRSAANNWPAPTVTVVHRCTMYPKHSSLLSLVRTGWTKNGPGLAGMRLCVGEQWMWAGLGYTGHSATWGSKDTQSQAGIGAHMDRRGHFKQSGKAHTPRRENLGGCSCERPQRYTVMMHISKWHKCWKCALYFGSYFSTTKHHLKITHLQRHPKSRQIQEA